MDRDIRHQISLDGARDDIARSQSAFQQVKVSWGDFLPELLVNSFIPSRTRGEAPVAIST
jgi:hypothetical protein